MDAILHRNTEDVLAFETIPARSWLTVMIGIIFVAD